jgi:hypothetical protein
VIKYDVLEHILRDWLWSEFGTAATYEVRSRRLKPRQTFFGADSHVLKPASESGAGYWKVTATREITQVRRSVSLDLFVG